MKWKRLQPFTPLKSLPICTHHCCINDVMYIYIYLFLNHPRPAYAVVTILSSANRELILCNLLTVVKLQGVVKILIQTSHPHLERGAKPQMGHLDLCWEVGSVLQVNGQYLIEVCGFAGQTQKLICWCTARPLRHQSMHVGVGVGV